jgi:hypothetical protein
VKVSRVTSLVDDRRWRCARSPCASWRPFVVKRRRHRSIKPRREKVCLRELLTVQDSTDDSPLTLALGKDTVGNAIVADLALMPLCSPRRDWYGKIGVAQRDDHELVVPRFAA